MHYGSFCDSTVCLDNNLGIKCTHIRYKYGDLSEVRIRNYREIREIYRNNYRAKIHFLHIKRLILICLTSMSKEVILALK